MPNPQLTPAERDEVQLILNRVREELEQFAQGDPALLFAARRKVAKELVYDERGKPMQRRALKILKRKQQEGVCAVCKEPLPDKNCVLDRFEAIHGYTAENTQLICSPCDIQIQTERRFT